MDGLSPAGELIGVANGALNFFDTVYAKVETIRKKGLGTQNYLRAYYLEVVNNIELLETINLKKLKSLGVTSPSFRKFIARLDTQIGASILFNEEIDKASDLYRLLKTKGKIANRNRMLQTTKNGVETAVPGKALYENILQAISFTVVKTELLKRLSTLDDDELGLVNGILLERRMINIRERFIMIKNEMDRLEGIREISR